MIDDLPLLDLEYWVMFAASLLLLFVTLLYRFNHRSDWVNGLRRMTLPVVHSLVKQHNLFAVTEVDREERVGIIPLTKNQVEFRLDNMGASRNIASSLKKYDGRTASSSYVIRESEKWYVPDALALRQVHIILFKRDRGTEVFAHEEYNSIFPIVGMFHYRGKTKNAEKGRTLFRKKWNQKYPNQKIQ